MKRVQKNMNASMFARDSYSQSILSNEKLREIGPWRPFNHTGAFNPDLDTSQGLYNLSRRVGLGDDADRAIQRAGGESMKYMSGGFIMDAMDVLNTLQYGVTGLVKGKGFVEGVKNRESFSDEDSLGKYGWMGKIGGLALDIALDPLTYVAPWKQLNKIPGFASTIEAGKAKAFGELNTIKIAGQEMQWRTGGWTPLNFLADRLVYGHAVDKNFRRSFEVLQASKENAFAVADDLLSVFSKIDPTLSKQTLAFADDGSMISKNLDELQGSLSAEDFQTVKQMYDMRDNLMKQLVEEGVISEAAAKTHWSTYLRQSYDDFLLNKKADFRTKGIGIDNTGRVATKETREGLTFIEDAAAVWAGTFQKQLTNLHNARMNKMVAKNFSLDDTQRLEFISQGGDAAQLVQVPMSPSYKVRGDEIDYKIALKDVQKSLKKVRKERAKALGDEADVVREIKQLETQLANLKEGGEKNLGEALSGFKKTLREAGIYDGAAKKKPTSEGQHAVADALKKWMNRGTKAERLAREQYSTKQILGELFEVKDGVKYAKTKEGVVLQKAFDDPQMMYQWDSPLEFLDAVRYPDKAKVAQEAVDRVDEISEAASDAAIKAAEKKARKVGKLQQTKEVLSETNLKLIRDAVDRMEQQYADLLFKKSNILEALNENARGQLAGKWMHKDTWALLKESTDPNRQVGDYIVQHFKKAKVIWNISSYPRNAMSAMIQNWWRLGVGPWNVNRYIEATSILRDKNHPIMKEMMENGFSLRSGAMNEILNNYVSEMALGKAIGGSKANVKNKLKHIDKMLGNTYGNIDNVAKVTAYKYGRDVKGWSPEKALEAAYEATYNYSQVTPFVHQMRRAIWGVPFITFNLKSVELVTSTLKYAPGRISVFGKARNALFEAAGVEGEQEAEAMPAWMRDDSFLLRLPWKDGEGRAMYFDLSYILPIGAIMDGSYLKDPISQNPVLQLVRELSRNQTFSGYKIFNESDDINQVVADIFIHTSKLGLPPVVEQQLPRGYTSDGERVLGTYPKMLGDTQDRGANERTFYQEMFRLAGMNVTPYDLESRQQSFEWKRKQNLEQMLVENGVLDQFTRPYLPEDSPAQPQAIFDRNVRPIGR